MISYKTLKTFMEKLSQTSMTEENEEICLVEGKMGPFWNFRESWYWSWSEGPSDK